jgi:hypothetical protein
MLSNKQIQNGWILGVLFFLFSGSALFAQDKAYSANEIQSFEAVYIPERGVQLNWASKYNDTTDFYIVERSLDGLNFETLAEVQSANTRTNHKYIDRNPYKEVSYYRLKVVDYDGRTFVSNLISTYIRSLEKPELVLYPMPVGKSQTLSLRFQGIEQSCKALVQVTDHAGRKVISREVELGNFQNKSELSLNSELAPGNYQITVVGYAGASFKIGKLLQIVQ